MDLEPRVIVEERLQELRAVRLAIVPEDQNGPSPNVAQQVTEERHGSYPVDGLLMHPEEELPPRSDPADRRELGPPTLVREHRRLAHRRPRLGDVGDQREPALVDEDDDGPSSPGFFLYRGHERRVQFWTARRSFSRA